MSANLIEELILLVSKQQKELASLNSKVETLEHQLFLFRNARFGRKSEKDAESGQLSLQFDEADDTQVEPEVIETPESETITYTRPKKAKGRQKLPASLPYVEKVYDIPESLKSCACGCSMTEIGEERSEQIDIVPQMAFRVVHVRKKYACKKCEENIQVAKAPIQPIPQSVASAGMLAHVIDGKFNRHMPLYRQEDIFNRAGLSVTRATLSHWVIKSAALLNPLVKLMTDIIHNYDIAWADETPLQVLKDKDKKSQSKSYMWLFIGGPPEQRSFIYHYHATRATQVAMDFFEDFKGYLHADCYNAYTTLGKQVGIYHVACMAHARRYFMDIVRQTKKQKGLAFQVVELIGKLYHLEKLLKEANANPDEIKLKREDKARPIFLQIKKLLDDNLTKVPPQSPLGKAVAYMLSHWQALNHYLLDGRLEIDNNRSERSIKPFVIGRKNWLFHGNDKGARAGATLYSLIETCKAHQVDIFAWLKHALTYMHQADTLEKMEALLPFNVKPEDLEAARAIPELIYPEKSVVN